jgi:hypothetical protein
MPMPTEIRHVMFSAEEAMTALRDYCVSAGRRFPAYASVLTIEGVHDPLVRVSAPSDAAGEDRSVSFTGRELAAPLLLYCRRKRIPLPARAEKQIIVLGGRLALVIKLR